MMFPIVFGAAASAGLSIFQESYKSEVLASLPAAFWQMDELAGATALDDVVGGADLAVSSLTFERPPLVAGSGTSIGFNGTSSYADGGDVFDPAPGESFTWESWMRTSYAISLGENQRLMDKRGQGGSGSGFPGAQISFGEVSSALNWGNTIVEDTAGNFVGSTGSPFATVPYTQNDGQPHHIVLVWDSTTGTAKLYIDAELKASQTNSAMIGADLSNARTFRIGAADTNAQYYIGDLDAPAVYRRALTENEIRRHYWAGKGTTGYALEVLSSGPEAYWRFDEQIGTVAVNDATGNGHVGEYHGGTLEREGLITEGSAVFLDKSQLDYISVPHATEFNSDNQSLEIWVKTPLSLASTEGLIYKAPDTGFNREFSVVLDVTGAFKFGVFDGFSQTAEISTPELWLDGGVHHVVAIKEYTPTGDKLYLYVDGVLRATIQTSFNGIQNNNEIVFGKVSSDSHPDRYFTGDLDESAVYPRVLTPEEILRHYDVGKYGAT